MTSPPVPQEGKRRERRGVEERGEGRGGGGEGRRREEEGLKLMSMFPQIDVY